MSRRVYLDNAATTPLRPAARDAMVQALDVFGNPSSVHAEGQAARFIVDTARRQVADALGVRAERVVFTSGGTEANNLALRGVAGGTVAVSAVEHDCVLHTARALDGLIVPVDENGVIRLDGLEDVLKKGGIALVSVMLANNETGVVQPVAEVAALARAYGALMHTDAVQACGHVPLEVDALGVDMLTVSAHKLGGPKGVGALVVRPEIQDKMTAQLTGGAQERKRRAGTENVAAIAGFGAACASIDVASEGAHMGGLIAQLMAGLEGLPVEVIAADAGKVPHILQLRTPGRRGEDMVIGMDLAGVAVSQGSACSSGKVQASHVLRAMGLDETAAGEGVRLSVGWASTPADIDMALAALRKVFT